MITKTQRSTGTITRFSYDYRNRLTEVALEAADGSVLRRSEYVYDVFDRRIVRAVDEDGDGPSPLDEIYTVYDGQDTWADLRPDGTAVARYLVGSRTDELIARWRPGEGTAWYLTDRLGSVRVIVDSTGAVINSIEYDPFGAILSETAPLAGDRFKSLLGGSTTVRLETTSTERDTMTPAAGRFLTEDSFEFAAGDTNFYRYVSNNPVNVTDPSGHIGLVQFLLRGAVGAAIGGLAGLATGYIVGSWCEYWDQWGQQYRHLRNNFSDAEGIDYISSAAANVDWSLVHDAGIKAGEAGALFGATFGFAFAVLPIPLGLTLGVGIGLPTAVLALIDYNNKLDQAWDNRDKTPEELFALQMCVFGAVGTAVIDAASGVAVSRAVKRIDFDKAADDVIRFLKEEEGSLRIPLSGGGGGSRSGKRTPISPDDAPENIRALTRENESADVLAANGNDVVAEFRCSRDGNGTQTSLIEL